MPRCKNPKCRRVFKKDHRHPDQSFCNRKECQRYRKTQWHYRKLNEDKDYRKNQQTCQKRWQVKHPDYWKQYRANNKSYTRRNREKQRDRNQAGIGSKTATSIFTPIANMDALTNKKSSISGRYRLIPVNGKIIAKMDPLIVEITEISIGYG